jgi:ATP-binding cassette subfamily C protein
VKLAGLDLPEPLAQALRACRPHFVAAAAFSFFLNLLFLAPAIYMLQIYDRVVTTGGKATLFFVTLALAIALVTLAALDWIRGRLLVRASVRLDTALAPVIVKRMMSAGGQENVQALRDFDTVRQTVASPAAAALFDAPWAPIFIIVAFMLHFWIGVLAVLSVLLLFAVAWRNQIATRETVDVATRALAQSHASGQAAALHGNVVRALGMTSALSARQLAQRSDGLGSLAQSQFTGGRFSAISRFIRLFVQSASLGLGALLAIAGEITAGAIIAASILVGRALQPVESLVGGWSSLNAARAALARLADVMANPVEADRIRTQLPKPSGRLDVEQVGVQGSEGQAVLLGVSFCAAPGEILGIIGPSGSGKTTLAKVIVGATIPQLGNVRIDGAQRSDWDPDLLGRSVGYLPQESSLFEGTIKDNVSRFAAWAPEDGEDIDAKVIAAAKLAGVHDLILQLPQGYDSWLGPLGAGLSAGQAQRVALARALYGRPNLLVLDEPNAFLDSDGEAALIRAIEAERSRGATILLIAHRRAILEPANRLLVLEGGRPKMIGPAREVVARLTSAAGAESAA